MTINSMSASVLIGHGTDGMNGVIAIFGTSVCENEKTITRREIVSAKMVETASDDTLNQNVFPHSLF